MTTWTPLETVWPAAVSAGLLVAAAGWGRRFLRPARALWVPAGCMFLVALLVRLVVVPSLTGHIYDGHEAEYWDLFRGVRQPNRGGTVLYPAMQWLWWGLGRALPHLEWIPVVGMAVVGSAGALLLGAALGRLSTPRVGWMAALLVAAHPIHAAWSTSAYNVIIPWTLGMVVLWCAAALATARHPPAALAWVGGCAWALVVATRMDAAVIAVPAGLVMLSQAPQGAQLGAVVRSRLRLLPALGVALALGGLAAWPLVFPGEVPGAGERLLSFEINLGYLAPMTPFDGVVGGIFLLCGAVLAGMRWPSLTAILLGSAVANHLLMASFDDYADRHALYTLPGLVWCVAGGAVALVDRGFKLGVGLWVGALALCVVGLADMRERFYGEEDRYNELLATDPRYASLPRLTLAAARTRDGLPCGWVNEDPRAAATPVASHFNVIKPDEAGALRGPGGCLRWCADVQDWRWSSRSVRDRALRTAHLYGLEAVGVVEEPHSGYSCLVLELGRRQYGGDEPAPVGRNGPSSGGVTPPSPQGHTAADATPLP